MNRRTIIKQQSERERIALAFARLRRAEGVELSADAGEREEQIDDLARQEVK